MDVGVSVAAGFQEKVDGEPDARQLLVSLAVWLFLGVRLPGALKL